MTIRHRISKKLPRGILPSRRLVAAAQHHFPKLDVPVALYRYLHPESRAVDDTTWAGSGGKVRRATCIYCRSVVATSSADYPETKKSWQARQAHAKVCSREFMDACAEAEREEFGIKENRRRRRR